jgi:predicted CXXCH cytochrome family protein
MARVGDAGHLLRMAALFGVGIMVFLLLRTALTPADFGRDGHYRASAVDDNRRDPVVHAGRAACAACHDAPAAALAAGGHRGVGCESCHGPLAAHAEAPEAREARRPDGRALCLSCHARLVGRPAAFPQVDADHAPEGACTECHGAHAPGL